MDETRRFTSLGLQSLVNAWITRFGDQITGVWCANDDMATGALEALRAEGLAGKVAGDRY